MFNLFGEAYTVVQVVNNKTVATKTYHSFEDAKQAAYKAMAKRGLRITKSYNNYKSASYVCHDNTEFHISQY